MIRTYEQNLKRNQVFQFILASLSSTMLESPKIRAISQHLPFWLKLPKTHLIAKSLVKFCNLTSRKIYDSLTSEDYVYTCSLTHTSDGEAVTSVPLRNLFQFLNRPLHSIINYPLYLALWTMSRHCLEGGNCLTLAPLFKLHCNLF